MPPFGDDWFRPLSKPGSLLGIIRSNWIHASMAMDEEEEFKSNKLLVELVSIYTKPDVYSKIKNIEEGRSAEPEMSFRIIYDTSDFTRRLNLAKRGEAEIHEQREDIRDKVREVRKKINELVVNDSRIHTPPTDQDYIIDEGPVIERMESNGNRTTFQIDRPKGK